MSILGNIASNFAPGPLGGAFGADNGSNANPVSDKPAGSIGLNTQNQIGSAVGAALVRTAELS